VPFNVTCTSTQAKKSPGTVRDKQTRIINTYFKKDGGKYIACGDDPYFQQLEEERETKYYKEDSGGATYFGLGGMT
jgi:hypothetical protein